MSLLPARGRMITLSALDGAGKSTQVQTVVERLRDYYGIEVVVTREPGGSPVAERLRELVLHGDVIDPMAEMMIFFAARQDHLAQVIRPALQAGRWVVCDRFVDCSWAYQVRGRGLARAEFEALEKMVLRGWRPDLTFLLDIEPVVAATRRRGRGAEADRFERQDLEFFGRVRQGYFERMVADPERFRVIDAAVAPGAVRKEVIAHLDEFVRSTLREAARLERAA